MAEDAAAGRPFLAAAGGLARPRRPAGRGLLRDRRRASAASTGDPLGEEAAAYHAAELALAFAYYGQACQDP